MLGFVGIGSLSQPHGMSVLGLLSTAGGHGYLHHQSYLPVIGDDSGKLSLWSPR